MPRLTKLDDVLFPVDEYPVFATFTDKGVERQLAVPDKKAIINKTSHRVLGIVGRGYRMVPNQEALAMAERCCRTVFPDTKPGEWAVSAVDAPSTAGYCHIDLAHNSAALDFSVLPPDQRPDIFGPFIRVTNSFNGLRALAFDIGFYRKVCKNGLILPESVIRFSFNHQGCNMGEDIHFEVARDRLTKVRMAFSRSLSGLRHCAVPLAQFGPLILAALQLSPPQREEPLPCERADWQQLGNHIDEMSNRYADELGENAYAAFNAITEFASRPPVNRSIHRDRNSFQKLAGSWLTSFNEYCREPSFTISSYIERLENEQANGIPMTPAQVRADHRQVEELDH